MSLRGESAVSAGEVPGMEMTAGVPAAGVVNSAPSQWAPPMRQLVVAFVSSVTPTVEALGS